MIDYIKYYLPYISVGSIIINLIQIYYYFSERSRLTSVISAWHRNSQAAVDATEKMTLNIEQKNAIELKSGLMTLGCFANSMNVAMEDEIKKKQGIFSKLYAFIKKFYLSLF
jgi:hypothetical protein